MNDDLISRKESIDALSHMCSEDENGITVSRANVNSMLRALPPAQSERKTGVWLIYRFGSDAQCSECKTFFSDVYDMENSDNYCRHCGTKMEGLKRVKDE